MFCRFLDGYFNVINLSDVGRSLDSFQMHGSFSTQPADVMQVTGQFSDSSENVAHVKMKNKI